MIGEKFSFFVNYCSFVSYKSGMIELEKKMARPMKKNKITCNSLWP